MRIFAMRICRLGFIGELVRATCANAPDQSERGSMFEILKKTQFSDKVFEFRVHAPRMAKKAHAGQFLMVRIDDTGERVPFTLSLIHI